MVSNIVCFLFAATPFCLPVEPYHYYGVQQNQAPVYQHGMSYVTVTPDYHSGHVDVIYSPGSQHFAPRLNDANNN